MKQFLQKTILSLIVISTFSEVGFSQCPATLTLSVSGTTGATCPDNGSVTLGGNGVGNINVIFKIVSGPSNAGLEQNSNIFTSLSAGNYIFSATCLSQTVQVPATIANLYTPLSNGYSVSTAGVCSNYTLGGQINVTGVTGGTAPIKYSFIANPAANYDDALSVYGAGTSYNVPFWDTYQVRVKDACGVFSTRTISVQPAYPAAHFEGASVDFDIAGCDSAQLWFWMNNDDGEGVGLYDYSKLKFSIYEKTPGVGCVPGALIKSFELTAGDDMGMIIPRRDVMVEITTPCGETRTRCFDYPDNDSLQTNWFPIVRGCGTVPDPQTMDIKHMSNSFAKLPVTFKLYNNTSNTLLQTVIGTDNWECCSFTGLALDTYRIEATDACGKSDTLLIYSPSGGVNIAPIDAGSYADQDCSFQNGKVTIKLLLTGLVPNIDTADLVITSGPDNIGQQGIFHQDVGLFYFFNLTPGATYGFSLHSGCTVIPLIFTVPSSGVDLVDFTMAPATYQQCGGTGSIFANITYSGWGIYRSELWQGGIKIDENNSGDFTNIAPGTYQIKAISEQSWCDGPRSSELTETVVVYNDGTPPQVLRQVGYVCKDGAGNNLSTGKANLQVGGFGPFRYDIKRVSPSPEASYTTVATNAAGNYVFNGLNANATYSILIIDNCGKSTVTEVNIGSIGTLNFETTNQPCEGSSYMLSAPVIPGATYSWTKDANPAVLSTTNSLGFPVYNFTYNGKYDVNIIFNGGCLERNISTDVSSTLCGFLLPVKFVLFDAKASDCSVTIDWSVSNEQHNAGYEVQRSSDGIDFTTIQLVQPKANNARELVAYRYVDNSPAAGTGFYRIKQTDTDKKIAYSSVVSVKTKCGSVNSNVNIYPNPFSENTGITVDIASNNNSSATLKLMDMSGKVIMKKEVVLQKGENQFVMKPQNIATGVYLLSISNSQLEAPQIIKVYKK